MSQSRRRFLRDAHSVVVTHTKPHDIGLHLDGSVPCNMMKNMATGWVLLQIHIWWVVIQRDWQMALWANIYAPLMIGLILVHVLSFLSTWEPLDYNHFYWRGEILFNVYCFWLSLINVYFWNLRWCGHTYN